MFQGGYISYLIGIDLEMRSLTMLPTGAVLSHIYTFFVMYNDTNSQKSE